MTIKDIKAALNKYRDDEEVKILLRIDKECSQIFAIENIGERDECEFIVIAASPLLANYRSK